MKNLKRLISLLLTFCALLLCSMGCVNTKNKDNLQLVRVNEVTHSIFYAPFYTAIEKGYFKEQGLKIELTNGGGADNSMTALLSNSADIGLMGPEAAMYVYLNGKTNYPIVFGQLTKRDGSFLISRVKEPNFDYSSLLNKNVIAGRKGGVPAMTLEYLLKNKGYTNQQNIFLNYDVQFNMTAPAFEGGTGDYCTLFEPIASELEKRNKGYVVASIGQDSGEIPYTAFMALSNYVKNNQEIITKFLTAVYKAINFLKTATKQEIANCLKGQFASTSDESIITSIERYLSIDAWVDNMAMKEEAFNTLKTVMKNAGELQQDVEFDMIINTKYANDVFIKMQE